MGEDAPKDASTSGDAKKDEKKESSAFTKKIIRIVTVMAYASGISGAGVLLSLYYIIFWDPQITGVRPPGYLRSGERIGVGIPEARMAPLPEAYSGRQPIAYPHKMSKEFMEAFLNNYTKAEDMSARSDLMEGQPTPKVMSVRDGSEVIPQHTSPTQPLPHQVEGMSNHLGHSPTSQQQQHQGGQQHQHQQPQQQHHQQRHHQQGEPLPTSA